MEELLYLLIWLLFWMIRLNPKLEFADIKCNRDCKLNRPAHLICKKKLNNYLTYPSHKSCVILKYIVYVNFGEFEL